MRPYVDIYIYGYVPANGEGLAALVGGGAVRGGGAGLFVTTYIIMYIWG